MVEPIGTQTDLSLKETDRGYETHQFDHKEHISEIFLYNTTPTVLRFTALFNTFLWICYQELLLNVIRDITIVTVNRLKHTFSKKASFLLLAILTILLSYPKLDLARNQPGPKVWDDGQTSHRHNKLLYVYCSYLNIVSCRF